MEDNIKIVEKDLAILSKKVEDIESEINNLELKLSLIKEMRKDEKLRASKEVDTELRKVVDRLHYLISTSGLYNPNEDK